MSPDKFDLFSTYLYLFGNKCVKSKLSISQVFLMQPFWLWRMWSRNDVIWLRSQIMNSQKFLFNVTNTMSPLTCIYFWNDPDETLHQISCVCAKTTCHGCQVRSLAKYFTVEWSHTPSY